MNKRNIFFGIALTILFFAIQLTIIDDYGLTWDFHHHFFAGLRLWNHPINPELVNGLPFSEPDPRNTAKLPFGPIMSMAPVATYIVFFEKLGLLAFDNAYNLSIVVSGSLGLLFLYLFLLEAKGRKTAIIGFLFLALMPRWWGDLHNNMKDVPQAAAFTFAIWMFWRLVKYQRFKDLLLAAIAFAIAFNTKVNTLTVPIIAIVWLTLLSVLSHISKVNLLQNTRVLIARSDESLRAPSLPLWNWLMEKLGLELTGAQQKTGRDKRLVILQKRVVIINYFILAPLFAFLLWWFFWPNDPIGQLLYIPQFFKDNTINIEVLLNGSWYCSGINVPWYYPLYYIGIVTPLSILFFFCIGIVFIVFQIISSLRHTSTAMQYEQATNILFILWFFVPIARYVLPTMGVIDGIRHFEEVLFPLVAIAAIGLTRSLSHISKIKLLPKKIKIFLPIIILLFIIWHLSFGIFSYHPYQISYFNELVGGIKGAFGKYDLDYWGSSQKKAILWLNKHAEPNARVYIVMAADVFGKYLRPDLRTHLNSTGYDTSDYVVVLNRQGFFYRYFWLWEYFLRRTPVHIVDIQGIPLTWIFDNSQGQIPKKQAWWTGTDPCIRKYW